MLFRSRVVGSSKKKEQEVYRKEAERGKRDSQDGHKGEIYCNLKTAGAGDSRTGAGTSIKRYKRWEVGHFPLPPFDTAGSNL